MNSVNLVGRLTKDPEGKTSSAGKLYVNFCIAVERGYKDAQGNKVVDFIPCKAWETTASLIVSRFKKGDNIGLTGRVEAQKIEDNQGGSKLYVYILVGNIDFIQGKKEVSTDPPKQEPVKEEVKTESERIQEAIALQYEQEQEEEGGLPFDI